MILEKIKKVINYEIKKYVFDKNRQDIEELGSLEDIFDGEDNKLESYYEEFIEKFKLIYDELEKDKLIYFTYKEVSYHLKEYILKLVGELHYSDIQEFKKKFINKLDNLKEINENMENKQDEKQDFVICNYKYGLEIEDFSLEDLKKSLFS